MQTHECIAWKVNLNWKPVCDRYLKPQMICRIKCVSCNICSVKIREVSEAVTSTLLGGSRPLFRSDPAAPSFPFLVSSLFILQVGALCVHQWASHVPPIVKWKIAASCCWVQRGKRKLKKLRNWKKRRLSGWSYFLLVYTPGSRCILIFTGSRHLPFSN